MSHVQGERGGLEPRGKGVHDTGRLVVFLQSFELLICKREDLEKL